MFERFTERARRAVVLAQEEARKLDHGYIGTEHLLLGLIREGEGVAARTLESLGISLKAVREQVVARVGRGRRRRPGTSRSPSGRRQRWNCRCGNRASWASAISAPSTSCWG